MLLQSLMSLPLIRKAFLIPTKLRRFYPILNSQLKPYYPNLIQDINEAANVFAEALIENDIEFIEKVAIGNFKQHLIRQMQSEERKKINMSVINGVNVASNSGMFRDIFLLRGQLVISEQRQMQGLKDLEMEGPEADKQVMSELTFVEPYVIFGGKLSLKGYKFPQPSETLHSQAFNITTIVDRAKSLMQRYQSSYDKQIFGFDTWHVAPKTLVVTKDNGKKQQVPYTFTAQIEETNDHSEKGEFVVTGLGLRKEKLLNSQYLIDQ